MNPIATIYMENGSKIVIELLPEAAPNTVNSFLYAALRGYFDHHAVERIVPGNWVDVSFTAFGRPECRYLIPNEFRLNPQVEPLDSHPGVVAMGGYGEAGLAGCEFFSLCGTARSIRASTRYLDGCWREWRRSGGWNRS